MNIRDLENWIKEYVPTDCREEAVRELRKIIKHPLNKITNQNTPMKVSKLEQDRRRQILADAQIDSEKDEVEYRDIITK